MTKKDPNVTKTHRGAQHGAHHSHAGSPQDDVVRADTSEEVAQEECAVPARAEAPADEPLAPAQIADVAALNKQLERYRAELLDVRTKLREREAELELSHEKGREASEKLQEEHALRLRAAADLENYRKRAVREREETAKFGQEKLLKEILPVLDNLERALDPKNSSDLEALRTGVEMTRKLFENTLARVGLKGFSAVGHPFDPSLHEAMQAVESDEVPGTVLSEMVRGFMLHDRLLRPAMVFVAKAREGSSPSPEVRVADARTSADLADNPATPGDE